MVIVCVACGVWPCGTIVYLGMAVLSRKSSNPVPTVQSTELKLGLARYYLGSYVTVSY